MTLFGRKKPEMDSTLLANVILIAKNSEALTKHVSELIGISEGMLALVRKSVEANSVLTAALDKFLIIQNRIALEEAKRRAAKEEDLGMTKDDLRF